MLNIVSVLYLIVFLAIMLILFVTSMLNFSFSRDIEKLFLTMLSIAFVALSICVFYIEPPYEWDLYRHYEILDNMRIGGMNYYLNLSTYKDLYVINFIYYLISLTKHNGLLPFFALLFEGIIFLIIYYNEIHKNNKISFFFKMIIILLFFALFNIVLAISGVRNNLAISIAGLALYLENKNKKNMYISLLLYIAAIFVHPISSLVLVIRIMLLFKVEKLFFVFIFIAFSLDFILKILSTMNGAIFQYIYNLVNFYQGSYVEYSTIITVINLIYVIFLFIVLLKLYFVDKDRSLICKFSFIYVSMCLGLVFNLIFFYRAIMFTSFLSIFIIKKFILNAKKRKDISMLFVSGYSWLMMLLTVIQLASIIQW